MKKRLQGFIAGLIIGAVMTAIFTGITVFAANNQIYQAETATFPVFINGEKWETDSPVVVIDGRTYMPLKPLGDILGVDIKWNAELSRVDISQPEEIFVITETGEKYHRANCPTVKIVKQRVTRQEARDLGYEPCGICQP